MYVINATKTEKGTTCLTVVPHVCTICNKAFLQESSLMDHFKTHEENPSVDNSTKITNAGSAPVSLQKSTVVENTHPNQSCTNSEKKIHSCSLCNRNFSSKAYLHKHIKLHNGERSYKCDICNKSFVLKDNLMKHFATHDPDKKRYFCLECGKGFTSRQYKEKHELIHLGEKPHICEICNRAFTLKTNLNKHVLIHSEDRFKYMCNICCKGFSSKAYLEKHHLIHIGEKPHVCAICHRAFTLKTNLHKHYLIHTGYRRFNCDMCYKRFKTKASLEQHVISHSGERPFVCPQCHQAFKQKSHLDRHMQSHNSLNLIHEDGATEIISVNEDCVEVVIGEQTSDDYQSFNSGEIFYSSGLVDSKNNRAYNVSTDSCGKTNIDIRDIFCVKQENNTIKENNISSNELIQNENVNI